MAIGVIYHLSKSIPCLLSDAETTLLRLVTTQTDENRWFWFLVFISPSCRALSQRIQLHSLTGKRSDELCMTLRFSGSGRTCVVLAKANPWLYRLCLGVVELHMRNVFCFVLFNILGEGKRRGRRRGPISRLSCPGIRSGERPKKSRTRCGKCSESRFTMLPRGTCLSFE